MNTTYFLNCVVGNVFRSDTSTALPAAYYLGMSKTEPRVDGSGVSEPNASAGYARILLDTLSVPDDGVIVNEDDIYFAETTDDWGTVTHFVIFDAETGGHLLMYGSLPRPRRLDTGSTLTVRPEALRIALFSSEPNVGA